MEFTDRQREVALDVVVEIIIDSGMYPEPQKNKFTRSEFDLYDFLRDHRDPSYAYELLVASLSSNTSAFEDRIERERATVEEMLRDSLRYSKIVDDLATKYAEEDAE